MFLFLYLLLVQPAVGFNLDMDKRIVYQTDAPQGDDWFGYTVELYRSGTLRYLLVGAPKSDTSNYQRNVQRSGEVYECDLYHTQCDRIKVDRTSHNRALNGSAQLPIDSKDFQFLGASLATDNTNRMITCAPLYTYFYSTFSRREPVGACYVGTKTPSTGAWQFEHYTPCKNERQHNYHRLGYATCGFSADLPKNQSVPVNHNRFFAGGPGAFYWQGTTVRMDYLSGEVKLHPTAPESSGKSNTQHSFKDNHLKGYSTATGDFDGDGADDVAVGAPRGGFREGEFPGLVVVYSSDLRNIWNISGERDGDGSYFGAAIATCDVDGDGMVDLIIGAPLYTQRIKEEGGTRMKYEVGKVYVYFQRRYAGGNTQFVEPQSLTGDQPWARFGYSVACAGDLDLDGTEDIVVGAPMGGEYGNGAVHVFNGIKRTLGSSARSGGINKEPSQILDSAFVHDGLKKFGFSVTGGKDMDDNGYPDIAVGSYASGHATLFRSRPILTISGQIVVRKNEINLKDRNCLRSVEGVSRNVTCNKFKVCTTFEGKKKQGPAREINITALITLDPTNDEINRALFEDGNNVMEVNEKYFEGAKPRCIPFFFHIHPEIRDKFNDIHVHVNYSLVLGNRVNLGRSDLPPIMDYYGTKFVDERFMIKKNCGPDKICVPDLHLQSKWYEVCGEATDEIGRRIPNEYNCTRGISFTPGDHQFINISINIRNGKEDAYLAAVYFSIPKGLNFVSQHNLGRGTSCFLEEKDDDKISEIVTCELANPFIKNAIKEFIVQLKVNDMSVRDIMIEIEANSTNPEKRDDRQDNYLRYAIPIDRDAKLVLLASAQPGEREFSTSKAVPLTDLEFFDQLGPNVTHYYQIRNDGAVTYKRVELDIFWPTKTASGNDLLYIVEKPRIIHRPYALTRADCSINKNSLQINPRFLAPKENRDRGDSDNYAAAAFLTYTGMRSKRQVKGQTGEPQRLAQTEEEDDSSFLHQGFRRFVDLVKRAGGSIKGGGGVNPLDVDCSDLQCGHIHCVFRGLKGRQNWVGVQIESRLMLTTLAAEGIHRGTVTSAAIAEVKKIENAEYATISSPKSASIATTRIFSRETPQTADQIPWWIWLIAVLAAIVFLLLIALLLWKCGFFKRNRPPREQALLAHAPESEYYGYPKYGDHL